MNRLTILLFALLAATVVALPVAADPLSVTGEQDIGALFAEAQNVFDVNAEDAVLLLDHYSETWTADGRRITSVHTIAYVRTDHAIDSYADLRVPWDAERQELTVQALRTWRPSDKRWIVSGETAVVHTLPHALALAVDYSNIRETMLLHDGVELPCVLETAYTITDREPFRAGVEGARTFARNDPSMRSEIVLAHPQGSDFVIVPAAGAPAPVSSIDRDSGLERHSFSMGPVHGLPAPRTAERDVEAAHLRWSSWSRWPALGRDLAHDFILHSEVNDELGKVLGERLAEARTNGERAEVAVKLAAEATRYIDYDVALFAAARPASRTWATAYGHRLDRAVLTAALLHEAGFDATPAYRGRGLQHLVDGPATLSDFEGPGLWVSGDGFEGFVDPAAGELVLGSAAFVGRLLWRPGLDDAPAVRWPGEAASHASLRLDLSWDQEAEQWTGSGVLSAGGALSPFDRMRGLDPKRSQEFVEGLAKQVLEGSSVGACNPARFDLELVVVAFELSLPAGERDAFERLRLSLGDPGKALASPLRAGVHSYEGSRGSALHLPAGLSQRVELHLEPGELEVVHLPESLRLNTDAGVFELSTKQEEDKVEVIRELKLKGGAIGAEAWPALRELLVADQHLRSRTLLLR